MKTMKTLGKTLKEARELIPMTLRQVEESTGISNAYLSQLENDKIKKPSANVLYKLASLYNITLDSLLIAAGIVEKADTERSKVINNVAFSKDNLTSEEEQALIEYLKYLRFVKKNG